MMNTMLSIGMPGGWEWIVILIVILLLFGGSRLPQLAKSIGQSKRAFREGLDADDEEARLEETRRREKLNPGETRDNARVAADEYAKENKR